MKRLFAFDIFKLCLVVLLAGIGLSAQAQSNTALKIIVPFTPGTGMDTIARTVQPMLSEHMGQPVVVQNMPGASGNIGADFVAKSAPDGNTVLMGANTMLIASQLYKNVPFNPTKDFAPVSMSAYGTLMLVANPKTGIKPCKTSSSSRVPSRATSALDRPVWARRTTWRWSCSSSKPTPSCCMCRIAARRVTRKTCWLAS